MLVFRNFAIRRVATVEARSDVVSVNPAAQQLTVRLRSQEDWRSTMEMTMTRDEAEVLQRQIGLALADLRRGGERKAAG